MNILLQQLAQRGEGYVHSSGDHCNVLAFADDLILLSDNAGRMQVLVDEVKQFAEWSGMWVNVSKSKITAFDFATRTEPKTAHITYGGSSFSYLPASETYKYLGFHISKSCVRDEISETIGQLKDTIYHYGQVEAMVCICVVPLFRYSASLVHWTTGELQALSTQFGIAMKNVWKVSKQCGRAILVASAEAGGWVAPLAESFVMQEQWSLYNQSNNHQDAVARSVKWNLERLMKEHCCSTIKALQMELWLNQCDSTWVERLLSQAASLSIFFASELDAETPDAASLSSLTFKHRRKLRGEIQDLRDSFLGQPEWEDCRKAAYHDVGCPQPSVLNTFRGRSGQAPQQFPVKRTDITGSAAWRTRRSRKPRRPQTQVYQPDDPDRAVARDSLLVALELADDVLLIRCRFDQTIRHNYRHKKVRHVSTLEVVEAMVHNWSTLTIPDVSLYWPEVVGSVKLRVDVRY
eukprot:286163-Rhodomonas_salina.1